MNEPQSLEALHRNLAATPSPQGRREQIRAYRSRLLKTIRMSNAQLGEVEDLLLGVNLEIEQQNSP